MGCDCHIYMERFSSDDYEGPKDISEERDSKINTILESTNREPRWITADKWISSPWRIDHDSRFYRGRNYYLFGVLAGVRGGGPVISNPRGVPKDASYAYRNELEMWDCDAHSESYYTLQELLEVDWSKYTKDDWLDDWMESIEKMKKIDPDPNKVRCVFFFDN